MPQVPAIFRFCRISGRCFRLVGQQQDPALLVLHHFMAIVDRETAHIRLAPTRVDAVALVVVAQDNVVWASMCRRTTGPARAEQSVFHKMSSVHR